MSNRIESRRAILRSGAKSLTAVATVALIGATASTAQAELMQATMTWENVSGSWGGNSFSNKQFSMSFVYDTADVKSHFLGGRQVNFANGRSAMGEAIRISLDTVGMDVAVDATAANNFGIVTAPTAIFVGTSTGTEYGQDRGRFASLSSYPGNLAALTTEWSATSNFALTSQFDLFPIIIGGSELKLTPVFSGTGSISFASYAVPAPGAVALLGLAGLAGRRRR
jgi:MYXO-CTERM domain-containing protein